MAFTQVTVTGTYELADGSAAEGFVRFTPRAPMHNGTIVVAAPVVATLNGSGEFSVSLAATDDTGTVTADGGTATYRVELVLAGQPARSYQIVLGHADVTQNLADIVSATPTLTAADWITQTQADALYYPLDGVLDGIPAVDGLEVTSGGQIKLKGADAAHYVTYNAAIADGPTVGGWDGIGLRCLELGLNRVIRFATASPEGVRSGSPGDFCLSADGAYVKTSGTGNTGWQKLAFVP